MLHPEIAAIDAKNATPEEMEKLLSDPLYRSLQYQIQHGVQNIELESNKGKQTIKNICVPEGEDQESYMQKIMAEDKKNKEREEKEKKRLKEKAHQEKIAKSDPYCVVVSGGGSEKANGVYERDGEAVRNGGRVFKGPNGFGLSFECVSGGEGWILGKSPRAFYANQTKDKVPPDEDWMIQEHGKAPAPTFTLVEPVMKVEEVKRQGNEAHKAGDYEAAAAMYAEALSLAAQCEGAHGIDDDLLAKVYGNRAEACLQMGQYDKAVADAELAIEYDPCFVKAYVRKAKASAAMGDHAAAEACLRDALEIAPGSREVLSLQDEHRVSALPIIPWPHPSHPPLQVLSLQDEYRVAGLARGGTDQVLTELAGLCSRLQALLTRKGTAAEVSAIFKQMPTMLTALKLVPDVGNVGDRGYESAPNYDAQVPLPRACRPWHVCACMRTRVRTRVPPPTCARHVAVACARAYAQVYFRMQTHNFALLAPLIRPLPKQPELLKECLETLAASLRDCPSNQLAFDRYVPQLVPLLRAKATLPYELLKASVKVLGAMAHRVAARKIMYDPDSAEGVMHVLSHPDSSQSRPATYIIQAIDELKDMHPMHVCTCASPHVYGMCMACIHTGDRRAQGHVDPRDAAGRPRRVRPLLARVALAAPT